MEHTTPSPSTTANISTNITTGNDISIRPLDLENGDFDALYSLWSSIFPTWPIPRDLLKRILTHPFLSSNGRHFVAETQGEHPLDTGLENKSSSIAGFILTYLTDTGDIGSISALGVAPTSRNQGIGTALVSTAKEALRAAAKERGTVLRKFVLGSETPRFWPGVPVGFAREGGFEGWWTKRGFTKSTKPIIRDLFKDIRTEVMPPKIQKRIEKSASENALRFAPWSEDGYEECLAKQKANFSWAKAYAVMAASSQYHEVMVAFDAKTNEQLGWTLMCGPEAIVKDMYAFLPLAGEHVLGGRMIEEKILKEREEEWKEMKIGLIAAVGVDEKARGRGVGLALVGAAMANLKERGVEGIFIDSVVIQDFYERLGFETRWEYETWECPEDLAVEGNVVKS